jgi:hypothetical protein
LGWVKTHPAVSAIVEKWRNDKNRPGDPQFTKLFRSLFPAAFSDVIDWLAVNGVTFYCEPIEDVHGSYVITIPDDTQATLFKLFWSDDPRMS